MCWKAKYTDFFQQALSNHLQNKHKFPDFTFLLFIY